MECNVLTETKGRYLNDLDKGVIKDCLESIGFSMDGLVRAVITPKSIKVTNIVKENGLPVLYSEKWGKMSGVNTEEFWMDGEFYV